MGSLSGPRNRPGRRTLRAGCQPVGEEHGLACPRRAHHQGKANLVSPVQPIEQPRPAHEPRHQPGDTELRGREPGSTRAGLSRHCRLRHSASPSHNATHPAWPSGRITEASPGRWNDITQGGRIKTTVLTSCPPGRAEARASLGHRNHRGPPLSRSGQPPGGSQLATVRDHPPGSI